eukprot:9471507-Pyramimonas_sp.AAC.1
MAAADKGEKKRAATGKAAADKPSTPDKSNGKKKKKAKGKPKAKPTLKRPSAVPLEGPGDSDDAPLIARGRAAAEVAIDHGHAYLLSCSCALSHCVKTVWPPCNVG